MICKHATVNESGTVVCGLGLFDGGMISPAHCGQCEKYAGPMRGAGDLVAKITTTVGIKPCGGCKKRQMDWNKAFPYGG